MWRWLVTHGLYESIVSWSVFFVMAGTVGAAAAFFYRDARRRLWRAIKHLAGRKSP